VRRKRVDDDPEANRRPGSYTTDPVVEKETVGKRHGDAAPVAAGVAPRAAMSMPFAAAGPMGPPPGVSRYPGVSTAAFRRVRDGIASVIRAPA
jgi:hypothetical protein